MQTWFNPAWATGVFLPGFPDRVRTDPDRQIGRGALQHLAMHSGAGPLVGKALPAGQNGSSLPFPRQDGETEEPVSGGITGPCGLSPGAP